MFQDARSHEIKISSLTQPYKPTNTISSSLCRLQQLAMPTRLPLMVLSLLLATSALIFWLWLVIVPARVATLCPEECSCDPGGHYIDCVGTSLTAVPLIRLTDVRELWLYKINITLFTEDSFFSLSVLEILSANSCGLRTIELGIFDGVPTLRRLYIDNNEISELLAGTFENMNSLEYFTLDNNRLEHLDIDVFRGLVNLNSISLAHNKLQYLHPDTFLGLPNLQTLFLNYNPGLQVPTDSPFINSHTLTYLDLSNCTLSSVSVETFANVSALEWLNVSSNNLWTVDINLLGTLPKLSTLYLHGNPLQCDCQLQEVWRWCEARNIFTDFGILKRLPVCDTPSEVEGVWWGVLEQGNCSEGNISYHSNFKNTEYRYNGTQGPYLYTFDVEFFKQYQVPIYAVPFIFGTTGNVILLIIIIRNKDMRTVPNMYILNLAISDIIYLTVLFCEACAISISGMWLDGEFSCTFFPFCRRLAVGLSAYSVAVYSVQRYRVTVNSIQDIISSQAKYCFTVATICGVWIVAALFAVPSALSKYRCEGLPHSIIATYYQLVVIFELLVSCVIPLCVVAFSYIRIARHLVVSSRPISEGTQNPQLQTRRFSANIVVGLSVVFVITIVPYHAFWTYINFREVGKISFENIPDIGFNMANYELRYPNLISTCLFSINSCLNPVALFCTSSPFRENLKRYLTCHCKTNTRTNYIELQRRN
jgi:Leucine-rich repeat (LRR) protein